MTTKSTPRVFDINAGLAGVLDPADEIQFGDVDDSNLGKKSTVQAILDLAATILINAQTGTIYTTVLSDGNKLITLDNAAAISLTIPTNASVAYPIGTTIAFQQIAAGLVTMSGAGVTFTSRNGLVSGGTFALWSITKTLTNTWAVAGDVTV